MAKIEIKNVYKIFGDNPSKILPMVQEGANKEEVLESIATMEKTLSHLRGVVERMK